jgi:multiple sugar transport system permease protein
MVSLSSEPQRGGMTMPSVILAAQQRPAKAGFFRRHGQAYLFMLPAVLLVAMVSAYPIVYSGFLSLFRTRFLARVRFIGLGNYYTLLTSESIWRNFRLSLTYVLGTLLIVIPFSLSVAILLNQPIRFRSVFRAAIILPWAVSQTIIALLWGWILNPDFGPGTYIFELLGLGRIAPLSDPALAMLVLIGVNAWGAYPLATTLFLASIQTIPGELIDATEVDGASPWQRFRYITLPLIRPTTLVITILISLHSFNMVTLVFILTGGGPLASTELLSLKTFNEAFQFWHVGFASALGISIFLVNVIFSLIYIRLLRRDSVT